MLNTPTTFVIGAGSGVDLKMPLGTELLSQIAKSSHFEVRHGQIVDTGTILYQMIFMEEIEGTSNRLRRRHNPNDILRANSLIRDGANLVASIDDYVNIHSMNADLVRSAKTHIAYSILKNERQTPLFFTDDPRRIILSKLPQCWLRDFFKLLSKPSTSVRANDFFRNVSIINFNYDRCLEHFLINAISGIYNINLQDAAEIVSNADIIHPYGQVGLLSTLDSGGVQFGGNEEDYFSLKQAASSLLTYSEQANAKIVDKVKEAITRSKRVVFLGFGFHQQNIDLLSGPTLSEGERTIIGTAYGESSANIAVFAQKLKNFGGITKAGSVHRDGVNLARDANCSSLIRDYGAILAS